MKVVQIIYNPTSGNFSTRRLRDVDTALKQAGARTILTNCTSEKAVIASGVTHICISGGDGTVRETLNDLLAGDCRLPISIHPSGTVNLLAKELGCSLEPGKVAERILGSQFQECHYVALLNQTTFLVCASVGPECFAIRRHSARLKRLFGRAAYVIAFMQVLWDWQRPLIRMTVEGTHYECEAVYIAKGRYFAGSWSINPMARSCEKTMHIVALTSARRRDYAAFVWNMLRHGDPRSLPGAICLTCDALSLHSEHALPIQADGDIVDSLPAHIRLNPQAIFLC